MMASAKSPAPDITNEEVKSPRRFLGSCLISVMLAYLPFNAFLCASSVWQDMIDQLGGIIWRDVRSVLGDSLL